jgi:hypothetical protein
MMAIFVKPQREVFTEEDLKYFQKSNCHKEFSKFVESLSWSVKDKRITEVISESQVRF